MADLWPTKGTQDPMSKEAVNLWEQRRLKRFMMAARVACILGVPLQLCSTVNWFRFAVLSSDGHWPQGPLFYLFSSEAIPVLLFLGFMIACDMYPPIVASRNLDFANILLHGMWAWRMVTVLKAERRWNAYWMLAGRLWQGLLFGNAWLSIFLNSLVVAVDIFVYGYIDQSTSCLLQDSYMDCPDYPMTSLKNYVFREVGIFVIASSVIWAFEQLQLAEAKALVKVKNCDAATRLVRGLLSYICDAVVVLDNELRLVEPCPTLSAILLRDGPLTPGMQFSDLIVPEDRERFLSCLSASTGSGHGEAGQGSNGTSAGLCHVRLKHRLAHMFQVSLFFSSMASTMGQVSYLIGIQESREEGHNDVPDAADAGCTVTSAAGDRLASLPENFSSLLSHDSRSGLSGSDSGEEADMYVWVDATSAALTVLGSSSDFALLAGPQGCCSALSEWLSTSDLSRVKLWLRSSDDLFRKRIYIQLITEKKWSYRCKLSVGSAQELPTAPASSKPLCLVVDSLVCKISTPSPRRKPLSRSGNWSGNLELWASVTDDGEELRITRIQGGTRELAQAFTAEPDLFKWMGTREKKTWLPVICDVFSGANNGQLCVLGVLNFTNPGRQCPSPTSFHAHVTVSNSDGCDDLHVCLMSAGPCL
eukprot:CAMPEP_0172933126 /NCGR_PEP_ID=MMETSP1075-20121228/220348_1 /TAXON_ID=2916 /ORGANISM="Ceratium fusus, Strain PA161109" /LENGTH=645 /DNA_ID=CAMNT_0013794463 /DNA_START=226 /DNA_END=2163 /DNA_ORIENTATION=+